MPSDGDQTKAIQAAILNAEKTGGAVQLGAGTFNVSSLTIKSNIAIHGISGATKFVASGGGEIFSISEAARVTIEGISFSAKGNAGNLITAQGIERLSIEDCEFNGAEAGVRMSGCGGRVVGNSFQFHEDLGLQSIDSSGLRISGNRISDVGNCGIQVWQTKTREDGSLITENHISRVATKEWWQWPEWQWYQHL